MKSRLVVFHNVKVRSRVYGFRAPIAYMASDEELARRVAQLEEDGTDGDVPDGSASEALEQYRETAGEIHDELARRIETVDEQTLDADALSDVVQRLDTLEDRIADLEASLS